MTVYDYSQVHGHYKILGNFLTPFYILDILNGKIGKSSDVNSCKCYNVIEMSKSLEKVIGFLFTGWVIFIER